jgi:hypothetical protein
VAANRMRLLDGTAACALPPPQPGRDAHRA